MLKSVFAAGVLSHGSVMGARVAIESASLSASSITLPQDGLMQYSFVYGTENVAARAPECVVDWGNIDANGDPSGYNYIGSKIPDSCCEVPEWQGAPEILTDSNGDQHTCYVRGAAFPGWRLENKMRLYLGCEDGALVGAEDCVPSTIEMYDKKTFVTNTYEYPMNNTWAQTQWKTDTPDNCGCSKRSRFNNGPGCYLAYATAFDYGQAFKGGADPTASGEADSVQAADTGVRGAVFVKIAGTCPVNKRIAAPAPVVTLPRNGLMQYSFVYGTENVAKVAPECALDWGNIDVNGDPSGYNFIGSKIPDSCCAVPEWQGAPEILTDSQGQQHTCYVRGAAFPGWRLENKMRLYLGCEDGALVGAEDCVPSSIEIYDKKTFVTNTYEYPMNNTWAQTQWKTDTPDNCGCSKRSRFNNGPGCYLAYATAFDYGQAFKGGADPTAEGQPDSVQAADTGVRGAVFVNIQGVCSKEDAPEKPMEDKCRDKAKKCMSRCKRDKNCRESCKDRYYSCANVIRPLSESALEEAA